ncbi:MAG: hypothetical protein KAT54_04420 [Candidatus Marinimicrobia bacterium]|nr:hypothetical protein [Candidatus Neomarinimicrobiota bacterium]
MLRISWTSLFIICPPVTPYNLRKSVPEDMKCIHKWNIPKGEIYVRCESSRGELGLYLVNDGGDRPYRVHFNTPSYNHGLTVLEKVLEGESISDVGNIMISLYIVAPEIDR